MPKKPASMEGEPAYISENARHHPFQNQLSDHTFNPCVERDRALCKKKSAIYKATQSKSKTVVPQTEAKKASLSNKQRQHRKTHIQVHLKKEDGEYKSEAIEYNVDNPHRVSVRMEYLMNTTKVRLNDKEFMKTLYSRLLKEEALNLIKTTEMRQAAEANRVKKLVINGLMTPPPDMLHLYDHPVFRVNKLFSRLDQHNKEMSAGGSKIEDTISPVEPFEFDGNEFFKHLHKQGTYWLPEVERIAQEEKMAGKIARARLRLLEKKKQDADQEKMLKLIYLNSTEAFEKGEYGSSVGEDDHESQAKGQRKKRRISKVRAHFQMEAEKRDARFKRRRIFLERKERDRKIRAQKRQKHRDMVFLEEREHERVRLIEKHRLRMENKNLDNLDKIAARHQEMDFTMKTKDSKKKLLVDYQSLFNVPPTPPNLNETESFERIRKTFHVGGSNRLSKYGPAQNHVMQRYIDTVKNANELFHYGNEVTELYTREQGKADDFMNTLNRLL